MLSARLGVNPGKAGEAHTVLLSTDSEKVFWDLLLRYTARNKFSTF